MSKQTAAQPMTIEQVTGMLRRATEALTAQHQRTAESVRAMREEDLRKDPILGAAYHRGWDACREAVHQVLQAPAECPQRPKKGGKPAGRGPNRPTPRTARTPPTPPSLQLNAPATSMGVGIPPLPSEWSAAEKERVRRFNPRTVRHPPGATAKDRPSTSKGSTSRQSASELDGVPVNRKTATTAAVTTGEISSGKRRKYERFLRIKEATKAKKARSASTSQQHRLAKHPVPPEPTATSVVPQNSGEPMETDAESAGNPAILVNSRNEVDMEDSGRDDIDVYLESSPPSLPDEYPDPPFFNETPPTSPGQGHQ